MRNRLAGRNPRLDPRLAGGFYVPPTPFTGVHPDMRIAREEIFGPVVSAGEAWGCAAA